MEGGPPDRIIGKNYFVHTFWCTNICHHPLYTVRPLFQFIGGKSWYNWITYTSRTIRNLTISYKNNAKKKKKASQRSDWWPSGTFLSDALLHPSQGRCLGQVSTTIKAENIQDTPQQRGNVGASLEVQWIRLCLPAHGVWVQPLHRGTEIPNPASHRV